MNAEPTEKQHRAEHHSIHAGYLLKLGSNVRRFKRRYCVLKPMTLLLYFFNEGDVEPRGCIDVDQFSEVSPCLRHPGACFQLKRPGAPNEDSFVFEADNVQECAAWMEAIRRYRYGVAENELKKCRTRCSELEEDIARCQNEMEMLSQYAGQRHQTALALRDERARRREIISSLIDFNEAIGSAVAALNSTSIMKANEEGIGECEDNDIEQRNALNIVKNALTVINEMKETCRLFEESIKVLRKSENNKSSQILNFENELRNLGNAYRELIAIHATTKEEINTLESTVESMKHAKAESDSALLQLKTKLRTVKWERNALKEEVLNLRQICKNLNQENDLNSSLPIGSVDEWIEEDKEGAEQINQKSENFLFNKDKEFADLNLKFGEETVIRFRKSVVPALNLGDLEQAPNSLEKFSDLANETECNASRKGETSLKVERALNLIPGAESDTVLEYYEEYELKFESEKIGLQLENVTSSDGRCQFIVASRNGYADVENPRPAIGCELISYNGINILNMAFADLAATLRNAGRPLYLKFREIKAKNSASDDHS